MDGIQNKKKQFMGIGFIVVLMCLTIWYILKDESPEKVLKTILSISPVYIVLAIALMVFYILCEGVNIWITLKALKVKTRMMDCLGYGFIGFYFSGITPSASGGQPAQVYFMNRNKVPVSISSLSLMILLFAHQLVIVVFGVIGIIASSHYNIEFKSGMNVLLVYGFLTNTFILVGILMLIIAPKTVFKIVNFFGRLIYKSRLIKNKEKIRYKVSRALDEYEAGAIYMRENPKVIIYVVLVSLIQVFAFFMIPYVIYRGMGLRGHGGMELVLMQSVLNIAVSSLPLPGAVGASESVFLDMFKKFFGAKLVIPGMLLTRIANFYLALVLSGIVFVIMYIRGTGRDILRR